MFVIGAGPGVGVETARQFACRGHPVGLVARSQERLRGLLGELESEGITARAAAADIRDPAGLAAALQGLVGELGVPEIACFCPLPDVARIKPVLQTTAEDLMASLDLVVAGAAGVVRELVPMMQARGSGALLFTTGSAGVDPSPERASSAVSTIAATSYIALLREALAPRGILVAQVVIRGGIGPTMKHRATDIAERVWEQYDRPADTGLTIIG